MPGLTPYPPSPQDVPTSPLFVIDYERIKARDADEIEALEGCGDGVLVVSGCSVLDLMNHGVHEEAEGMFAMGEETIALTLKEKLLFEQDKGTRDVPEFVNIFKDDALAWPAVARRMYPSVVNALMQSTITPFVKKSLAINNRIIGVLKDKLGLPGGTLASLHKVEGFSGCIARFLRAPPYLGPEKTFLTAHTDFGTLLLLHSRLGGLQVLPPGSDQWFYIKPLPGHAICNIGDAFNIFSGGILRSNIHCVVPPSREQAQYERHSVVFFTRPNDTIELCAL
ncbi:Clavaminate synthase-like protein [Epithele typhae]|uniref:Clavaminate synthase-like protein n=1 Tax=Epithele typhae TaxID=378194 RepID=UPI0020085D89|nr:Clavaminate synthase-like protein [Epithele typhae]KAH9912908.1 Clavaminate synthase-like protein [Epithele typhae]